MVRVSRRRFTATSLAGVAAPGRGCGIRIQMGNERPGEPSLNMHARKAAEAIKRDTDGRFDLQLFPNNQLGGDTDMFSQLRVGALERFTLSGVAARSTLVPSASISGVGFAFPNYQSVRTALDGKETFFIVLSLCEAQKGSFTMHAR